MGLFNERWGLNPIPRVLRVGLRHTARTHVPPNPSHTIKPAIALLSQSAVKKRRRVWSVFLFFETPLFCMHVMMDGASLAVLLWNQTAMCAHDGVSASDLMHFYCPGFFCGVWARALLAGIAYGSVYFLSLSRKSDTPSSLLPFLHLCIDSSRPTSLPASFVARRKASLPFRKELWL